MLRYGREYVDAGAEYYESQYQPGVGHAGRAGAHVRCPEHPTHLPHHRSLRRDSLS